MIACGVDLVRIQRLDDVDPAIRARFIMRVFTEAEQAQLGNNTLALAGVFAAKEALSKALGTGIGKVSWRELEVIHAPSGEPRVHLKGQALIAAQQRNLQEWSVSISHDGAYAIAMAVAQSFENTP